jgi:hypothetical protein
LQPPPVVAAPLAPTTALQRPIPFNVIPNSHIFIPELLAANELAPQHPDNEIFPNLPPRPPATVVPAASNPIFQRTHPPPIQPIPNPPDVEILYDNLLETYLGNTAIINECFTNLATKAKVQLKNQAMSMNGRSDLKN